MAASTFVHIMLLHRDHAGSEHHVSGMQSIVSRTMRQLSFVRGLGIDDTLGLRSTWEQLRTFARWLDNWAPTAVPSNFTHADGPVLNYVKL